MEIEDINTCYPAKIESYDPETQLATCKLQVEDYYTGINYSYRKQEATLLIDVPVMIPQAGNWMLTFPILEGMDCLVFFAQKGYDHWLYSGASETGLLNGRPTPEHYREFSYRDAICIVGLKPVPRAIPNYNNEDMELRNDALTQKLVFKKNGDIEVHTDTNISVNANEVKVTAQKADITSPATSITTDMLEVTSPMSKFSGSVTVGGGISMGGARSGSVCELNGVLKVTGSSTFESEATFSADANIGGKSFLGHKHTDAEGRPTSPPA